MLDHLLNGHAPYGRLRGELADPVKDPVIGGHQRFFAIDGRDDSSYVLAEDDVGGSHLEDDGVPHLPGGGHGFLQCGRHPGRDDGDAVIAEKFSGVFFREDEAVLPAGAPDEGLEVVLRRCLVQGEFSRGFLEELKVSLVLDHIEVGTDGSLRRFIGGDAVLRH